MQRRPFTRGLAATLLGAPLAAMTHRAVAKAGNYPSRPVRLVVPFTPGGGSDVIARQVGHELSKALGQNVIVENRPGAGGSIGSREIALAEADGHSLLLATSSTHGINPFIYRNPGYDAQKEFAPISMLATSEYALSVAASSPIRSVAELIERGKAQRTHYASSGNGTTSHLCGALLASMTSTPFVHVPYQSSGPARTDLIGGQVEFNFDNVSVHLPLMQSGKLRILATSGRQRTRATPDVPTLIEAGVADFEMVGWFCLLAPARTPEAIVTRLNDEVLRVMRDPAMIEKTYAAGNEPYSTTPAETRDYMARQLALYRRVVEIAGARID